MITLSFPNPADSPTGSSPVRLRYRIERRDGRPVPVLHFPKSADTLSRERWQALQVSGATLAADSERERQILAEALGADAVQEPAR